MTPAEAWEHAKALWPDAVKIERNKYDTCNVHDNKGHLCRVIAMRQIEWPEGMTEYPPPQKLYRPAIMPTVGEFVDFGKEAEFSDDGFKYTTFKGKIAGYRLDNEYHWLIEPTGMGRFCRIPLGPEWRSMDTAPKNGTEIMLMMGGKELRGYFNGTSWVSIHCKGLPEMAYEWDCANQPVAWKPIEEKS